MKIPHKDINWQKKPLVREKNLILVIFFYTNLLIVYTLKKLMKMNFFLDKVCFKNLSWSPSILSLVHISLQKNPKLIVLFFFSLNKIMNPQQFWIEKSDIFLTQIFAKTNPCKILYFEYKTLSLSLMFSFKCIRT